MPKLIPLITVWLGKGSDGREREWRMGTAVMHREGDARAEGRKAHVVALPAKVMGCGQIPIMYDDTSQTYELVPAEELQELFPNDLARLKARAAKGS